MEPKYREKCIKKKHVIPKMNASKVYINRRKGGRKGSIATFLKFKENKIVPKKRCFLCKTRIVCMCKDNKGILVFVCVCV